MDLSPAADVVTLLGHFVRAWGDVQGKISQAQKAEKLLDKILDQFRSPPGSAGEAVKV